MNTFRINKIAQLSKLRVFGLGALLLALGNQHLNAQVGGDNPTGVAGSFNGQITTGCSYDAYTGNATRSCTDLAVTSVGKYPLALVRTANSRRAQSSNAANPFGVPGHWNHSYNWILQDSEKRTTQPFQPSLYTVEFPDGRVETFQSVSWDPGYYRVRAIGDDQTTSAGLKERLVPMNPPNNMVVKLYLPDGGRVEFLATLKQSGSLWYYSYVAQAIYDPYGLATTLTHETSGSGRLTKVTEPAGRYLQFTYRTLSGQTHMIDKVTEYINNVARRVVQYNYTTINPSNQQNYLALTSVGYFSQWTATYTYCIPNTAPNDGVPLLKTCDDPMYSGPMHKIAYVYRTATNPDGSTPANGQIQSENYYNGTVGPAVSTLTVGVAPNVTNKRTETRGDGKTRTFTYGTGADSGFLMSWTDFMSHGASQTYDSKKYINSVTDRNSHRTDYTLDPITGNVTLVQFPAIATPSPAPRGTLTYEYTNTYYVWKVHDEAGNITTYTRDPNNHRVTRIDYPDGGYETFSYDAAHLYQLSTHRMTTGGTETFAYDTWHRRQYYSDPYHSNPGSPSIQYSYDVQDRVSGVTDALSQNTSFSYNDRGQLTMTTLPPDPVDGTRHTIINTYNNTGNNTGDGTLISVTDQLNHTTSYTYDDYRRLKSLTVPRDQGQATGVSYTTSYFYDTNGVGDNYTLTDSNVTFVVLPSGKKTKISYDDNRRKQSVIVGYGAGAEAATTSFTYDSVGNLTVLKLPLQQSGQQWNGKSTVTDYDERNRPWRITDALNYATIINYDQFGRKSKVTRPNNQSITYFDFDEMNRPRQTTATDVGTTKYTYYAGSGLLHTMQDPRLVNTTDTYSYTYDGMGRKTSVTYPADSGGLHRSESLWYDTAGRPWKFTNRDYLTQTFGYDALNRMTGFSWDDRATPSVTFGYDADSRLTSITNTNAISNTTIATVTRTYFDDNLLKSESENLAALGGTSKTVIYSYDADGNRASIVYPGNSYTFTYSYTPRNQLGGITDGNTGLTYLYNLNGDMNAVWRAAPTTTSSYGYDALDRVTHIEHALYQDYRSFDYDYDSVGNRKWMKREDNSGDVFGYDLNDQVIACWMDILDPVNTDPGSQTIFYDGSGNWTIFEPYDWIDLYTINNLNQYTQRTSSGRDSGARPTPTPRPPPGTPVPRPTPRPPATATYDNTGTMSIGFDGSTYIHDAQNRLISATKDGVTMLFDYDGLNRQVSRRIGNTGARTFSVWDGWDLIEEYQSGNNVTARYLYGPNGLAKNLTSGNSYFQDGSGSTRVLTDDSGHLLEWYLYDLQGTPIVYDPNGNLRSTSAYGARHLFTGQQWYQELGLYDLRNRFYSPDIGRFLQPDPIGFDGDSTNLYRYCRNNPVMFGDPLGLWTFQIGLSFNIRLGLISGSFTGGVAFDGHGNIAGFKTYFGGIGDGAQANAGVSFAGSTADTVYGLAKEYYNVNGGAGLGPSGSAQGFWGTDPTNGKRVYGGGISVGPGVGGGGSGGASYTTIYPWVAASSSYPPPGGSTYVDPNGCGPGCATVERVVVTAPPVYESGSYGGPTWGNGVGIFNTTGFNAQYTSNFYGYTGSLPTTLANPYGSWVPSFGVKPLKYSIFGKDNYYSGLNPIDAFGHIYEGNPIGAMEPGLGCFAAGTPVLMADGTEKPIEAIQAGEAVLAWNEETRQTFPTRVIKPLHHEAKAQTLFDIELEDGRRFTVNNNHPIYVIEDDEFIFTRQLTGRFANAQSITFQDNQRQPVRVANIHMRREICKVYNLEVEGQGKNGHTYYASGVLVHNSRAGNEWK